MLMDSVYQNLGKSSVEMSYICSMISGVSAGKTWSLEISWQLEAGIIWSLVHTYLWLLLAFGWDLSWDPMVHEVSRSNFWASLYNRMIAWVERANIPRTQGRNALHFYNLAAKDLLNHFYYILLVDIVTKFHRFLLKGHRSNVKWRKWQGCIIRMYRMRDIIVIIPGIYNLPQYYYSEFGI